MKVVPFLIHIYLLQLSGDSGLNMVSSWVMTNWQVRVLSGEILGYDH